MPSRFSRWAWGSLLLVSIVPGCALPDYHLPRGYSGTYARALEGGAAGSFATGAVSEPGPPRTYVPTPPAPGLD